MSKKFNNSNRAKVKKPLPTWVDIPKKSGYYWYYEPRQEELPPSICSVDVSDDGVFIFPEGSVEEIELQEIQGLKPKFSGPLEVPISPFLTEGLSKHSVVGSTWAFDADRMVICHLRNHTEVDLEQDSYSGWILWLRNQHWFSGYMEEEFRDMCEKYAPKGWLR